MKRHKVTRKTKSGKTITYWRGSGAGKSEVKGIKGKAKDKTIDNTALYKGFSQAENKAYIDPITGETGKLKDVPAFIKEAAKKTRNKQKKAEYIKRTGKLPFTPTGKSPTMQKTTKFKAVGKDERGNRVFESHAINTDKKGKYIYKDGKKKYI